MKKRKKIIIAVSVAVVVVVIAIIGFTVVARRRSAASTTTFREQAVKKGSISISVSGSGSVSDATQQNLTSYNTGTIDSLSVKQGDKVKAGQEIAHISDSNSALNVLQKQNSLTNAQSALSQSEQQLNSLYIKSPAAGKVKSLTVSAGDDLSTIRAIGNLMAISTSRSMTVSFNASGSVTGGESVKVVDGKNSYTGTITSTSGQGGSYSSSGGSAGSVTVTIGTDDPGVGDSVKIYAGAVQIGTGSLQLAKLIAISSTGSGTVDTVYVRENQMVGKNQNLIKLNGDSLQNDITIKSQQVTTAQKDLDEANKSADKDTIKSPVDGVIAQLDVKNGDSVSSGTAIATIIDPGAMQTVVSIDELDITKVEIGQKANITLDAFPDKTFTGSVTQIDPIGTASNGVATYNVTVSINKPQDIKVGMTTNVEIITQSKDSALVVPTSALVEKNGTTGYVLMSDKLFDGNGSSLKLNDISTRQLIQQYGKEVTIGLSTQDSVEIVSGLSEGDKIAIPITINNAAYKSLTSSQSGFSLGGGMGGNRSRTGNTYTAGNTTNNAGNTNEDNSGTVNNTDAENYSGNTGGGNTRGGGNN